MPLTPELTVSDFASSLAFYRMLGFTVDYERPEDGFAMLRRADLRLMIDSLEVGRNFDSTLSQADRPFGRGINLEIQVDELAPLLNALSAADWPLHLPPEDAWYRAKENLLGQRQFVVADPDGYLLRFVASLGQRPAHAD